MAEIGKEKVTMMKLTVDLECSKCYKKVKRVLCKFPQIRDTIFDEKSNAVIIKVVCCSPEKIMDKLCCKGGGSIKTIEIIEPPTKPPPQPKPKPIEKPKETEKPKEAEKPKQVEKPKEAEKPKEVEKPKVVEKPKEVDKPPAAKPAPVPVPKQPSGPPQQPQPQPQPVMPQGQPGAMCCGQCYEGYGGGPCFNGYGMAAQPYECYGRPVCENWGGGPPCNRYCHVTRCDCLSEDNPQNCSIM